jgi:hypothetical protein
MLFIIPLAPLTTSSRVVPDALSRSNRLLDQKLAHSDAGSPKGPTLALREMRLEDNFRRGFSGEHHRSEDAARRDRRRWGEVTRRRKPHEPLDTERRGKSWGRELAVFENREPRVPVLSGGRRGLCRGLSQSPPFSLATSANSSAALQPN